MGSILAACCAQYIQSLKDVVTATLASPNVARAVDTVANVQAQYHEFREVVDRHCTLAQLDRPTAGQINSHLRKPAKEFESWKAHAVGELLDRCRQEIHDLQNSSGELRMRVDELENSRKNLENRKREVNMDLQRLKDQVAEQDEVLATIRAEKECLAEEVRNLRDTVSMLERPETLLNVLRTACQSFVLYQAQSQMHLPLARRTFRDASNAVVKWYKESAKKGEDVDFRSLACNEIANAIAHDRCFHWKLLDKFCNIVMKQVPSFPQLYHHLRSITTDTFIGVIPSSDVVFQARHFAFFMIGLWNPSELEPVARRRRQDGRQCLNCNKCDEFYCAYICSACLLPSLQQCPDAPRIAYAEEIERSRPAPRCSACGVHSLVFVHLCCRCLCV